MLYIAVCKKCNHLLHSSDSHKLKQEMASHMKNSHKIDYGAFVEGIRLSDFETFNIIRVRKKYEQFVLKNLLATKGFFEFHRNRSHYLEQMKNSFSFSGLLSGENN